MAKKTYILEIVYDDEKDKIIDFCEYLEADVLKYKVNEEDIGACFDKETRKLLKGCTDLGLS